MTIADMRQGESIKSCRLWCHAAFAVHIWYCVWSELKIRATCAVTLVRQMTIAWSNIRSLWNHLKVYKKFMKGVHGALASASS